MPEGGGPAHLENDDGTKWAGLRGWPLLEQFMTDLDTGMVNGYNDDINTYLTFAGLFSAVLTGLLVISFALLQPDSTDTTSQRLDRMTMILDRISLQLFNSSTPPNELGVVATTDFKPFTASLWINSLWFSSLILSLASALLAVVAKQWLREYLSWTTMSGPSEQQVLLRQVRYEGFIRWKVTTIIAFIPILLEVSLIMFLIGLAILLRTLDDRVVSTICTAEIAILVILAVVVTVFPTISPQCAYKSSAGWALLRGWHLLRGWQAATILVQKLTAVLRFLLGWSTWRPRFKASKFWKDWRQRELVDRTWITVSDTIPEPQIYPSQRSVFFVHEDFEVSNAVAHIQTISAGLKWVADTSQDTRIMHAIEECTPTYPDDWAPFSRLVVDLHVACTALDIDLYRLVPPEEACAQVNEGDSVVKIESLLSQISTFRITVLRRVDGSEEWKSVEKEIAAPPSMLIHIAHSIARSLSSVIDDLWAMESYGRQAVYYLQAASDLATSLLTSAVLTGRRTSPQLSTAVAQYATIFEKLTSEPFAKEPHIPRFIRVCISLYEAIRRFEDKLDCHLLLTSEKAPRHTRYALNFPQNPPTQWRKDECEIFIDISKTALAEWRTQDETIANLRGTLLPRLFARMQACAERCLQLEEWPCLDLWPYLLYDLVYSTAYTLPPDLFPHDLISALKQCYDNAPAPDLEDYLSTITREKQLPKLIEWSSKLHSTSQRLVASTCSAATDPLPSLPSQDASTCVQLDTSSLLSAIPGSLEARPITSVFSNADHGDSFQSPVVNDGWPYQADQVLSDPSMSLTVSGTRISVHGRSSTETAEATHLVDMRPIVRNIVHGFDENVLAPQLSDEDADGRHGGLSSGSLQSG